MENSRIMVMDCQILHFSPDIPKEYYEEIVRQTGDRFLETPPKY